tara:strand:- start:828 stop:1571 length:744 start_codon:yes stop_codon:yes gene_type:complete
VGIAAKWTLINDMVQSSPSDGTLRQAPFSSFLNSNPEYEGYLDTIESDNNSVKTSIEDQVDSHATNARGDLISKLTAHSGIIPTQDVTDLNCDQFKVLSDADAGAFLDQIITDLQSIVTVQDMTDELEAIKDAVVIAKADVDLLDSTLDDLGTVIADAGTILADAGTGSAFPGGWIDCMVPFFPQITSSDLHFGGILQEIKDQRDTDPDITAKQMMDALILKGKTDKDTDNQVVSLKTTFTSLKSKF